MTRRAALLIAVFALALGTIGCGERPPVSTNKDLPSVESEGKNTKTMTSTIPNPK